MEEDEYIYELFEEILKRVNEDDPNGRMRVLSKNPRFAGEVSVCTKEIKKHIEKR